MRGLTLHDSVNRQVTQRPFNLRRRDRDPVTLLKNLVGGRGLPVDADQEVGRPAA